MITVFLKLLNMSISASWLAIVVLVLRFALKKAPKWTTVLLWGMVAVRLVCPLSFESTLSLHPGGQTLPQEIVSGPDFNINSGVELIDRPVNEYLNDHYFEGVTVPTGHGFNVMSVLAAVWVAGVVLLTAYAVFTYWRLYRRVAMAVLLRDNIYQSENVGSPFVLGIVRPRIYLPFGMDKQAVEQVIAHEQAHISRRDHWWKPLGFILLTVHWFNPLMWVAYVLLCRDIELACDEKVIKSLKNEQRADYTQVLVACSTNRSAVAACPLAFGEVGVKERVKSVMNYKKPAFWVVAAAVVACVAVAVCFLTDPVGFKYNEQTNTILSANHFDMRDDGGEAAVVPMYAAQLEELSSRLAGVNGGKKSDAYDGLTPVYQISALLADGSYIRVSGYSLSSRAKVDIDWNGDRYVVSDVDFQNYLSRVCAGEDVAKIQIDYGRIIELLELIQSSPLHSSNPGDYISEHDDEYNELLSYGACTLKYCFDEFLRGGQTDLRGHIMAQACLDIMAEWGEEYAADRLIFTGQDWFKDFERNTRILANKLTGEDMQNSHPGAYILFQMIKDNAELADKNDIVVLDKSSSESLPSKCYNTSPNYLIGNPEYNTLKEYLIANRKYK